MSNSLFPAFETPTINTPMPASERKYKQSLYFDFETGDFVLNAAKNMVIADGREAYIQWCIKVLHTERFACLSYSTDIGVESDNAMKQPDFEAVKSALEKTITEALMVNHRTEYVREFEFTTSADSVSCSCTIKGKEWEEQKISAKIRT